MEKETQLEREEEGLLDFSSDNLIFTGRESSAVSKDSILNGRRSGNSNWLLIGANLILNFSVSDLSLQSYRIR